ncbi:MAG TPA: class I SAM-dependent methyltransferase [Thermomicrobiales bacterium]|nr:class I SAM-dependent methyltransferase [Thermomicrobiales bacterium]
MAFSRDGCGWEVDTIRATYDRIAVTYVGQRDQFASLPYLGQFAAYLPAEGNVLDLGCGGGIPIAADLVSRGFAVHGFDLSPRMIDLARENVPDASFEVGNMIDLRDGQFDVDGIVSFYAIFHTPREHHLELLKRLASFLPAGGALLISMGASDWEGEEDFHGERMLWSHYGAERNTQLVEAAGFSIRQNTIDRSGGESHQIILALRR